MKEAANAIHGLFALAILAGALAFAGGFVLFAQEATRASGPADPAPADAIVALTGGSAERLRQGVALLEAGKGQRLLISGVDPRATDREVAAIARAPSGLADRIDYGRAARTTIGNAQETAAWMAEHGFSSLILVTDSYHMPRSLLELQAGLPGVRITPYRVLSPAQARRDWWADSALATRLMEEYLKLSAIRAREAAFSLFGRPAVAEASA
jgi:uncharacterized SAM-binding protein YcdF (DUF218 family)